MHSYMIIHTVMLSPPHQGQTDTMNRKRYSMNLHSDLCVFMVELLRLLLCKQKGTKRHNCQCSSGLCLHFLISGKHVWHFATVEQVVDVLHKSLILDLRVTEQENSVLGLSTSTAQDTLQVFPPLNLAIALGNLHLA